MKRLDLTKGLMDFSRAGANFYPAANLRNAAARSQAPRKRAFSLIIAIFFCLLIALILNKTLTATSAQTASEQEDFLRAQARLYAHSYAHQTFVDYMSASAQIGCSPRENSCSSAQDTPQVGIPFGVSKWLEDDPANEENDITITLAPQQAKSSLQTPHNVAAFTSARAQTSVFAFTRAQLRNVLDSSEMPGGTSAAAVKLMPEQKNQSTWVLCVSTQGTALEELANGGSCRVLELGR